MCGWPQAHLRSELGACPTERPTYLLGEGFGGLLALAAMVAME